jgi:hypothetical protein
MESNRHVQPAIGEELEQSALRIKGVQGSNMSEPRGCAANISGHNRNSRLGYMDACNISPVLRVSLDLQKL